MAAARRPPPVRRQSIYLVSNRLPRVAHSEEAVIIEAFAKAHDLSVGDRVPAVLNGTRRDIHVVGIGMSPESIFAISNAFDFTGDPKRFCVLWMDRSAVAPIFQMEGAFDDIVVRRGSRGRTCGRSSDLSSARRTNSREPPPRSGFVQLILRNTPQVHN